MRDQFDSREPPTKEVEDRQSLSIPRLEMGIEVEVVRSLQGRLLVIPPEGACDNYDQPVSLYHGEISHYRIDIDYFENPADEWIKSDPVVMLAITDSSGDQQSLGLSQFHVRLVECFSKEPLVGVMDGEDNEGIIAFEGIFPGQAYRFSFEPVRESGTV